MAQAASDSPPSPDTAMRSAWKIGDRAEVQIAAGEALLLMLNVELFTRPGSVIAHGERAGRATFTLALDEGGAVECALDAEQNISAVFPSDGGWVYIKQDDSTWIAMRQIFAMKDAADSTRLVESVTLARL